MLNPSKTLFFMMLVLGTLISIMSNSWPATWMGLEINLLAFIPLMYNKNNIMSSEASMKYFVIQAMASSAFLTFILISYILPDLNKLIEELMHTLISATLMIKMGAAPFHLWFPMVMEGLSWINCLILMTWQKLAPIAIISYLNCQYQFLYFIIISSILVGSIGGLNQTSIRKIMAYSSINHIGWMMMAMTVSEMLWQIYFIIYSILTTTLMIIFMNSSNSIINQFTFKSYSQKIKLAVMLNMMSLGGLPPFLGFLPKWMVIQSTSDQNIFMIIFMVSFTLITLFYYLQLAMSSYLLNSSTLKWNYQQILFKNNNVIMIFTSISLFSLPLYALLMYSL
uniref:NADH dehydrogenase subunit 2 n=1 Tax=Duolandrevus obsidianus TaxID=2715842 RepID=UPI0030E4352E